MIGYQMADSARTEALGRGRGRTTGEQNVWAATRFVLCVVESPSEERMKEDDCIRALSHRVRTPPMWPAGVVTSGSGTPEVGRPVRQRGRWNTARQRWLPGADSWGSRSMATVSRPPCANDAISSRDS